MKKFCLALVVFAVLLYGGRHFIAQTAFENIVEYKTGEKIAYTHRYWEGEKLIYEEISLGDLLFLPSLEIDCKWQKLAAHLHLSILQHPLEQIIPVPITGTLSTELNCHFKGTHLASISGFIDLKDVQFNSNDCTVNIDELSSPIDLQGNDLALNASWSGLDFFWNELQLLRSQGSLSAQPGEKPTFASHATLHIGKLTGEVDCSGHGTIDLKGVHHVEGQATFVSATTAELEFSYAHHLLSAFGIWGNKSFSIELKDLFSAFQAKLQVAAPLPDQSLVAALVHLERKDDNLQVTGTLTCEAESVQFQGTAPFSFETWNLQFQGKELNAAFFNRFSSPLSLEGRFDVYGTFNPTSLEMSLHGDHLTFSHPTVPGKVKMEEDCTVYYVFDQCKIENFSGVFLSPYLLPIPFSLKQIYFQAGTWNFDATLSTPQPLSFHGEIKTIDEGYSIQLQQPTGSGKLSFIYTPTDTQTTYLLEGTHLQYGPSQFHTLQAHLIHQGETWTLKAGRFNDFTIQGTVHHHDDHWMIPSGELTGNGWSAQVSGLYAADQFDFHVDANLLSRFDVRGQGLLNFSHRHIQNLSLQIQDHHEPLAHLACDVVQYEAGKWTASAIETTLFSPYLKTTLQGTVSPSSFHFQGPLSQGTLVFDKQTLQLKEIYGLYENSFLNLKCNAEFNAQPFQLIGKFSTQPPFAGAVHVKEGLYDLQLSLSDPKTLQSLQGECFGIRCALQRNGAQFEGELTLSDSGRFLEDFPAAQLNLQGQFEHLPEGWAFQGKLHAQGLLFEGRHIQEIFTDACYTPTEFHLKNFGLYDTAGLCSFKTCDGFRKTTRDPWEISVPFLKAQEIRWGEKPLVIRNLILSGLKGELGNRASFRGHGSFNFSQHLPKDPSLFDVPKNFFKDLGLDLDLCTPVTGEVSIELRRGQCLLTDLRNVLSEGARSTFLLDPSIPSTIDLDGRLSLHLRMLQSAPLKLMEPFTMTVEGTWEKPRYSLRARHDRHKDEQHHK